MPGFEHYQSNDYHLASWASPPVAYGPRARHTWGAGEEPLYYVVSPKDVVLARPRDLDDRVQWLLQHDRYEEALEVAQGRGVKAGTMEEVRSGGRAVGGPAAAQGMVPPRRGQ